ncbi:hypothetical protein QR680_008825 [Steinernema hermaphroditum]|uniref:Uncharacterized protein n=1 Tax=Steinernema hermaphroditum TaxID=289476 RepID=A0AA39M8L3_9BILA|nr:hypothetical protein QR680_008825 [Steinernema hermaphroditum]
MVSESFHTAAATVSAGCSLVILSLMIFFTGWGNLLYAVLGLSLAVAIAFNAFLSIQYYEKLRNSVAPIVTTVCLVVGIVASLISGIIIIISSAREGAKGKEILHAAAMYSFLSTIIGVVQILLLYFAPPPRFENINVDMSKKFGADVHKAAESGRPSSAEDAQDASV